MVPNHCVNLALLRVEVKELALWTSTTGGIEWSALPLATLIGQKADGMRWIR